MADRDHVIRDLRYLKSYGRVYNIPAISEIAESALELLEEQKVKEQISDVIHGLAKQFRKPIVRCKDCIHYHYYGLAEDTVSECTIDHCENPDKEWFCADGERKDNNG